jgi:DNA invertase Pin-like site-specific DNA recombinase
MGKAMFTIIGAMAELESSLISERVKAGMDAAKVRGKTLGRPKISKKLEHKVKELAANTNLSINKIREEVQNMISRATIGKIVKNVRDSQKI